MRKKMRHCRLPWRGKSKETMWTMMTLSVDSFYVQCLYLYFLLLLILYCILTLPWSSILRFVCVDWPHVALFTSSTILCRRWMDRNNLKKQQHKKMKKGRSPVSKHSVRSTYVLLSTSWLVNNTALCKKPGNRKSRRQKKSVCVFFNNNNTPPSLTKATRTQAIEHQITSTVA